MKNLLLITILIISISADLFAIDEKSKKLKIILEVVRAHDNRLPNITDSDFQQILDELKNIILYKLTNKIDITFHDHGIKSLKNLFTETKYQDDVFYKKYLSSSKYKLNSNNIDPIFNSTNYKKTIINFLESKWTLTALKTFTPNKEVKDYIDFFNILIKAYHEKINELKKLKINKEHLLINSQLPYLSYVEWIGYMYSQNKYDLILCNTIVIYDNIYRPYPHCIFKSGKVGGSAFMSPNREIMHGNSIMMSTFEQYGKIKGIYNNNPKLSRDIKNKVIACWGLAHEFGHAFFLLPDFYDHGNECLMNTNLKTSDMIKGYQYIINDLKPCIKCQPWIDAKLYIMKAEIEVKKGNYKKACNLYIEGIKKTPKNIAQDYSV